MTETSASSAPSSSTSTASSAEAFIYRNLTIKPFVKQTDHNETAVRWGKYKKDMERQFRFFGITDPELKKDGLLIYGGEDLIDIEDSLPDPPTQENDDAYKILIRKIDNHFMPKKNKDFARFQMSELKQQNHERLADYYAKLREISRKCEYGDHENDAIRDHLIRTMLNHRIRSKAIRENWNLDRILNETALEEETEQQAKAISSKIDAERSTERIKKIAHHRKPGPPNQPCLRCSHDRKHETCPAMGATCDYCGKPNHYASVCIAKSKAERPRENRNYQGRSHRITRPRNTPQRQEKRDAQQFPNGKRGHQGAHQPKPSHQSRTRFVQEMRNDDSSSEDDAFYLQHLNIHHTSRDNRTSKEKTCHIQINGIDVEAEPDSGSDANIMDEHQFKQLQQQAPQHLEIKDTKIKLKTLRDELPVVGEADVIMSNETRSVNTTIVIIQGTIDSPPLIVQPKPKNPNAIRACLDLRLVNKSMLRTRQVQAPITEDFITEFKGCMIFSKLDLNHGYHQFTLDEESRRIMTFSTPWGNYRYKRLAFGGLNSQDLFDAEIAKIISGIPRTLNNRDDIMVGGMDWTDHNTNLNALLQRIEDHNLTLRKEKCEFGKSTLNFHGHLFTQDGLKHSPEKIKAVQDCHPPKNKEELISFLQMLAYLSRYISNFSSKCEPLRRLTRNNAKFHWTNEQQQAFVTLKTAITTAPVLVPYYPERDTLVICDGSPTGLGGGLFQRTQHGYQPVHYVSRTLTDTESRYSQIEREALAAEFATSRLQMYLGGGKHFQLATDHKPLLTLFNNPQAKLPPRVERMVMKMQNLDFTMVHIPGKTNVTDYMSRHPLPEVKKTTHDKYVRAITQMDHAIVLEAIAAETKDDTELQHLKHAMHSGLWDKKDHVLKPYIEIQAELYQAEEVVLRLDKIIPPESLREKIIRIAHKQGHLGLSKTKEMIRHKYWWPGMNLQIEHFVKRCFECQITTETKHTEPAKMRTLPERPWTEIEADFCGPFPNGQYAMVVTDQYSRYPEVEFVTTTSFEATRKKLKKIFSIHGVPETLQTDNGPPFNSHAFAEFAKESGFQHKRITPVHPKAQGQVEGFNKMINKTITIARQDQIDPQEAI